MDIGMLIVLLLLIMQAVIWVSLLVLGGASLYFSSSKRSGGEENRDKLRRIRKQAGRLLAFSIAAAGVLILVQLLINYLSE